MNKTRLEWSTVYKCCKDKRDSLTAFYSLFSTILTLSVLFYASVYCIGSRYSIVDTIDAAQIAPSTSASSSAPSSSTSSSNPKRKEIKKQPKALSLNNDDDSDEEPILNNNLIQMDD
jgi:hypothetical protein